MPGPAMPGPAMAEGAVLAGFAAALVESDLPVPTGLAVRVGADPARRFAVYRNNVTAGLVEAVREGFPVTERIVGEAFFQAMARAFVAARKPASPVLSAYGSAFPAFVAGFAPAMPVTYLAEVAALEAACTEAYHAAELPALEPAALAERLATSTGATLLAVRLAKHPAARLVICRHPAGSIWQAHRDAAAPEFAGPWIPETVLVTRPAGEVRVRVLDTGAGGFTAALLAGASVGEAGATALQADEGFDAGGALIALAAAGAIADLMGATG